MFMFTACGCYQWGGVRYDRCFDSVSIQLQQRESEYLSSGCAVYKQSGVEQTKIWLPPPYDSHLHGPTAVEIKKIYLLIDSPFLFFSSFSLFLLLSLSSSSSSYSSSATSSTLKVPSCPSSISYSLTPSFSPSLSFLVHSYFTRSLFLSHSLFLHTPLIYSYPTPIQRPHSPQRRQSPLISTRQSMSLPTLTYTHF
jgi:hypothetical protein